MIERLEGIYELGEEMAAETSYEVLYEKVKRDVFEQLLADGAGVEQAESIIQESVEDLRGIVEQMIQSSQENMEAVVGLGDKLMKTCRPEGVLLTRGISRTYVCMSDLAIMMANETSSNPHP
ncbi:MAG: hypothetical protein WBP12_03230 [Candidatus Saccharimonas sp.]